jgi:translocation and assembly module TamB
VEGRLAVEGLDAAEGRVQGELVAAGFGVASDGMDVATVEARAILGGRWLEGALELEATVASGATVRLPRKAPRQLQSIEARADILVGAPRPAPTVDAGGRPARADTGTAAAPLRVSLRVRAPEVLVKSDQPRVYLALRTDSTWEVTAAPIQAAGTLDLARGTFEPIAGRLFTVVRGRVAFPGGPLPAAQLDLAADYQNPTALVHAVVGGTLGSPTLRLTSEPPLDEASLAMLIATGRAEVSAGGTQPAAFTAQDAGMAAALALANRAFEERLGEKLPLDSLTLDASTVTAGKQLTDRILVNYVRRFDARPEKGENVDEVRVQYHLSPRWTLESRYGNAGAGGASLIWQKDY